MHILQRFQDTFFFMSLTVLALLFLTHLICMRWFKTFPASPMSGSFIMASALYVAECLPKYHVNMWVLKLLMLEVTVLWIYGSFSLLHNFFLRESSGRQSDRFGMSAWIVCTTLVAIMISRIAPIQHGVILLLMIFAFLLWIKYASMVCHALVYHIKHNFNEYVSASLLLGAAGTACIAWLVHIEFREHLSHLIYPPFVILACFLYIFIFSMWLSHYFRGKMHHLLASWNADNSLVYGAAALIGMVGLMTPTPEFLVDAIWYWTAIWCLIVTAIDIGHLCVRVAVKGLSRKVLIYDVRHWLRIFSYCMFYVFSWYYYFEHYADDIFPVVIVEYGLYFVTTIFIAQIIYTCLAACLVPHDTSSRFE